MPDGGNYWDTWTSPDANRDGIVDNPFYVFYNLPLGGCHFSPDTIPVFSPKGYQRFHLKVTSVFGDRPV
jgi:hypothetical protein